MKYFGKVINQKPVMPSGFWQAVNDLEGQEVELTIRKKVKRRSNNQNAYMWGVMIPAIADCIGIDNESAHEQMMQLHSVERVITRSGHTFKQIKRTSQMSTAEMEDYNSRVRIWASEFLGLYIPLPNEVQY